MAGVTFSCLLVMLASSRATSSPRIVTTRAAIFKIEGIVMTGVFMGGKL